ncbi:MAG TPA: 3-hydroxyacyl-ACP dehydratase FabZ [Firmicutes bacterium]|nr:3-hydroxyacyl-ACP dehydratase FabZ [Bacillota bacterium]
MKEMDTIFRLLPHRYPMLMVDRILELEPGVKAVAVKNVTINEPFFQGHYPGVPVMPGVLIVEAMAQVGGLALKAGAEGELAGLPLLTGIDEARFRRRVVPGDQLRVEVEILRRKPSLSKVSARCLVDGEVVAEAMLLFGFIKDS